MTNRIEYVGIDHVQLAMPAGQEDDARRFYADVLGLIEAEKPPGLISRGGCWFIDDRSKIHVHLGVDPDFHPAAKAHPAFLVHDLDGARACLADAGAEVVEDNSIAGVRRFYTTDPFGNRLEFIAESDREFTGRGNQPSGAS